VEQEISTGEFDLTRVENTKKPVYITLNTDEDFKDYDFDEKMSILEDIMEHGDFVRLKVSAIDFETIPELMMFREKGSKIKNLNLMIENSNKLDIKKAKSSERIEDIIEEQEEDNEMSFVTKENLDIFNNVKKFINVRHDIDLPLDRIKDIMISK